MAESVLRGNESPIFALLLPRGAKNGLQIDPRVLHIGSGRREEGLPMSLPHRSTAIAALGIARRWCRFTVFQLLDQRRGQVGLVFA